MREFDFWQKWGLELNDRQFADALLTLGVISAAAFSKEQAGKAKDLRELLVLLLAQSKAKDWLLPWRFPKRTHRVWSGHVRVPLSTLNPLEVAKVWSDSAGNSDVIPRIRILGYPIAEDVLPWFRMLFEAEPKVRAAHIDFGDATTPPHWKWPLRFGYLIGNSGEEIVQQACAKWPANELGRSVKIDRDNANCDVLVFTGWSRQLLQSLLAVPGRQKINLVILRGRLEDDTTSVKHRLAALASESSASGFVFLHPDSTDEVMSDALNRFVDNLSHNYPLDVAVCDAFTRYQKLDPAIFLSKELAIFQLEHVLEKIHSRLVNLPKAARPQIASDSFSRMNIPVHSTMDDVTIPETAARKLKEYKSAVRFDAESSGALGMAEMSEAIDDAESELADETQQPRFLQEQIFVKKEGKFIEEHRAFLKGVPTLIRVRIGPPDKKWETIVTPFPVEKLPKDREEWRLTVILTEPNHMKEPLRSTIKLQKTGPSTACGFRIQPQEHLIFEGRITVLHRGRILQTAVLRGPVVVNEGELNPDKRISFDEIVQVRSHLNDLEGRRQFDLAFVMNHALDRRPRLTAIADKHAWLADISACQDIAKNINDELTKVAESEEDYRGGLGTKENVGLLVKLAQIGRQLYGKIVEDQIKDPDNQNAFANMEYIQIVSTKTDALMPLEFIYTTVAPNDDAKLCPRMTEAVSEKNKETRTSKARALFDSICQLVDKGKAICQYRTTEYVCPMGFWGISRVIERHMTMPRLAQPGSDFFLQSEATTSRGELQLSGTAIVAASEKVKPETLSLVLSACSERLGSPPQEAKDWSQWVELVKTFKPHILLALPHTAGNGPNATLEINGKTLSSGQITSDYVHAADESTFPLVALLGCDTAGTALDYGDHVSWFRRGGAALVISTIAKVFGGHAAAVAEQLIKGLSQESGRPERIGEIIREIKRQAMMEGTLMALCVVAFGDADWKLSEKEN